MNFYNKILNSKYPYIIAEIGSNHNGSTNLAKKLIKKAKLGGADAVKFQSWSKNSLFSKKSFEDNYFLKDDYRNRSDTNLEDILEKYSFKENQMIAAANFAKKNKIDFSSTPFSVNEVDFLINKIRPPFIKIASMDLNNIPFIEYIAKKKLPIIISTGLSNLKEIDLAISTIEKCKNKKIIIMHCVAIYPTNDIDVNLNNIETLQKAYGYPIGFSDHSLGFEIPLASVVKGVKIIEKHFTLDRSMEGWDHKVSADLETLKIICKGSKRIIDSLGSFRIQAPESKLIKKEFKRSAVATKNLPKGHKITNDDINYKRPGRGIEPNDNKFLVNRLLNKDIEKDKIIYWKDLL